MTEQLRNMPFAPSSQTKRVPYDISDDDLGESDSDLETRITDRQRDLYVSRYGDILSDSEGEDGEGDGHAPISLKRPPPPPLQPIIGPSATAGVSGSKRPRRAAAMDEKTYQLAVQQHQQQIAAAQAAQAAAAAAQANIRNGKVVRSFFPA